MTQQKLQECLPARCDSILNRKDVRSIYEAKLAAGLDAKGWLIEVATLTLLHSQAELTGNWMPA